MKATLFTILIITLFTVVSFSQTADVLHIPVSNNAPFLEQDDKSQIGLKINNYGIILNGAKRYKGKVLMFSMQYNTGIIGFNPLSLSIFDENPAERHLIQSTPTRMFYGELGVGYDFEYKKQRLSVFGGIGQQFINVKTRLFAQIDWRNENRLMDVGVSARANYSVIDTEHFIGLTPVIQTKIKLWKIRIVNQFGYSISIKKSGGQMKPIFTLGLEFIL